MHPSDTHHMTQIWHHHNHHHHSKNNTWNASAHIHAHMHAYMHTYMHKYIHMYIHSYTRIQAHDLSCSISFVWTSTTVSFCFLASFLLTIIFCSESCSFLALICNVRFCRHHQSLRGSDTRIQQIYNKCIPETDNLIVASWGMCTPVVFLARSHEISAFVVSATLFMNEHLQRVIQQQTRYSR